MSVSTALARRGLLMLVLAGVLWGTGGLLGQLLAESSGLSPLGVAAVRLAAGGGLILAYLRGTGRPLPRSRAAWLRIVATGLLAATFQASYFTAVTLMSVSLATLITIGAAPVIVLIARYRAASRNQVVGTALALLGLAMLIGLPTATPASGALLAGAACALLAGAGFAVMTLLGSRPVAGLDDVTTVGVGFTIGGLVLASIVSGTSGWSFMFDLHSAALLLALAIIPTALAYTCYFCGLRSTSAGTGSVLAILEPFTATVLAALLLGERIGTIGLIAGAVLALAMVMTAREPRAEPVRPE